ncbi:MAG: potassium-transporting ATPase subunit B, partial [Acidisphaera sp.]|nr:potassium-transporting ATPase subunit B [Acidisphaera sp.]
MLDTAILVPALGEMFRKLSPRLMARNPVMFVVEVVATLTTVLFLRALMTGGSHLGFTFQIILWLWITLLFANLAEAVAEGRGKAQADTLRRTRSETVAYVQQPDGTARETPSTGLKVGDLCVVEAGQLIPGDGDVVEGIASVDESAITGESA